MRKRRASTRCAGQPLERLQRRARDEARRAARGRDRAPCGARPRRRAARARRARTARRRSRRAARGRASGGRRTSSPAPRRRAPPGPRPRVPSGKASASSSLAVAWRRPRCSAADLLAVDHPPALVDEVEAAVVGDPAAASSIASRATTRSPLTGVVCSAVTVAEVMPSSMASATGDRRSVRAGCGISVVRMSGRRGRKTFGRGFLPGAGRCSPSRSCSASAPAAQARVTLVATGTPELAFLGIPGNAVVARLALPGPARAVAVSRDGARGYVTAGGEVVAVDVNTRLETGRSALGPGPPEISDLELSPGGETLYAVRGTQLLVLDAQTLAPRAVDRAARRGHRARRRPTTAAPAAVTLRSGRVAMVALGDEPAAAPRQAQGRDRRRDRRQRLDLRHGARAAARHRARPARAPARRRSSCPPAPAAR